MTASSTAAAWNRDGDLDIVLPRRRKGILRRPPGESRWMSRAVSSSRTSSTAVLLPARSVATTDHLGLDVLDQVDFGGEFPLVRVGRRGGADGLSVDGKRSQVLFGDGPGKFVRGPACRADRRGGLQGRVVEFDGRRFGVPDDGEEDRGASGFGFAGPDLYPHALAAVEEDVPGKRDEGRGAGEGNALAVHGHALDSGVAGGRAGDREILAGDEVFLLPDGT